MPTAPARQAEKLPDAGAATSANDSSSWRKAILAGMVTSPQGVLGSPTTSKATLG
ncbi:hypothetical protein [Novosphingobium rhizosphaerae]|uniref:hypothetical protein n=1 Tax=Novosphingobium rhizosphaerae TaxID=1551649 RepID=UPI0017B08CA0